MNAEVINIQNDYFKTEYIIIAPQKETPGDHMTFNTVCRQDCKLCVQGTILSAVCLYTNLSTVRLLPRGSR